VVDVKAVVARLGTTTNTATSLINDFLAQGVLVEVTGQKRNRLFVFSRYLRLFERGG